MKGYILYIIILLSPVFINHLKADTLSMLPLSENEKRKFDYFFLEALNYKQSGKYSDAFNTLLHAINIDSTSSAALYEIANYYMILDKPDLAIETLRRAVKYNNSQMDYKIALGNISRELGMNEEAAEIYEELTKTDPDKPELYYYLSEIYTQEGEIDKAIKALDTLENNIGMNESLSLQKYRLYSMIEQKESAFKELEKLTEKFPMEARYPIIMGDLYLSLKEPEKAYNYYQKAYKIDPQNPYYVVSMASYYEYMQDNEAAAKEIDNALRNPQLDVEIKLSILTRYIQTLHQNKKEIEVANSLFETLLEQHPQEKELNMMYGDLLLLQNKIEEAKFQYQIVIESSPDVIMAWKKLLNIALKENKPKDCIDICNKALEQFPNDPEFYFYKGIAYSIEKQPEQALVVYMQGVKEVPADNIGLLSDFYGQIGDTYHQLKQKEKAYESYEKALSYNDKNIGVLNNYAYFLSLDNTDLSKAERMSAQCVKMQPENITYIDTYAWIFFKQGNYTLAKFYIESAMSKEGDKSDEIVDHCGDILYMIGDVEKAVEQWKKAVELGKDTPVLKRKITDKKYYEDEIPE